MRNFSNSKWTNKSKTRGINPCSCKLNCSWKWKVQQWRCWLAELVSCRCGLTWTVNSSRRANCEWIPNRSTFRLCCWIMLICRKERREKESGPVCRRWWDVWKGDEVEMSLAPSAGSSCKDRSVLQHGPVTKQQKGEIEGNQSCTFYIYTRRQGHKDFPLTWFHPSVWWRPRPCILGRFQGSRHLFYGWIWTKEMLVWGLGLQPPFALRDKSLCCLALLMWHLETKCRK